MADGASPLSTTERRSSRSRTRFCKRCKFSTSDSIEFLHHHLSAHDQNTDEENNEKISKNQTDLGEKRTRRRSTSSNSRRHSGDSNRDIMDDSNNNLDNKTENEAMDTHRDYDDVVGLKDLYDRKDGDSTGLGGEKTSPIPSPTSYPRGAFVSNMMAGGNMSIRSEKDAVNGDTITKPKSFYGEYQSFFNDDVDINQNTDRKAAPASKDDGFADIIKPPEIPGGMRLAVNNTPSGGQQTKTTKSPASGKSSRPGCAPIREAVDPAKYVTIREPDGTKYACSKCGNIYKWRKSLNKHWKEKHDGEIPDPRPNMTQINIPRPFPAKPEVNLPSSMQGKNHPFSSGSQLFKMGVDHSGPSAPTIASQLNRPTIPDLGELYSGSFTDRYTGFSEANRKIGASREREREFMQQRRHLPYPTHSRDHLQGMMNSGRSAMSASARAMKHSPGSAYSLKAPSMNAGRSVAPNLPAFVPMEDFSMGDSRRSPSPKREFSEVSGVLDLSRKGSQLPLASRAKMDAAPPPPQDEPLDFSMKPSDSSSKDRSSSSSSAFQKFVRNDFSRREEDMEAGYSRDKGQSQGLQCPSCAYVGRDKQDFDNHMELHMRKRHHKCSQCQQVFFSIDDLNRHFLRQHIELVQSKLHGSSSDGSSQKQPDQPRAPQLFHYLTTETKELLTCMVCGAIYQYQWTLAKHFDEDHPSIPNPYGRKGQRTQPDQGYDEGYEQGRNAPENGDPLQCDQCDFRAGSASEQARHQLKHSINRSLFCKVCGFTTRWREELAQHQVEVHNMNPLELGDDEDSVMAFMPPGSEQMIDLTDETTAIVIPQAPEDTALMEQNSNNASRTRPKKGGSSSAETLLPFKCSVCEYRARWPSEITQHMKNHSDEKPYLCPRCSYRSKWKWDVVKHLKRCGGGTVKDVIDTTKQKKQLEVKALLRDVLPPSPGVKTAGNESNNPSGFLSNNGRNVRSNGPPNVTIVNTIPKAMMSEELEPIDELNLSTNSNSSYSERGMSPSNISPSAKRSGSKSSGGQVRGLVNHGQHYCLQCPFVGNSPAELKRHSRVHSDAKPFICKTCGYCSKWKCDLKKHLKTYNHTSAVPLVYGGHGRKPADWYNKKESKGEGDEEEMVPDLDSPQYQSSHSSDELKSQNDSLIRTPTRGKSSKKCKQCDFETDDLSSFLQHKLSHTSSSQEGTDTPTRDRDSRSPSNQSEAEQTSGSSSRHRRKASTQHRIIPTAQDNFESSDEDHEPVIDFDGDDVEMDSDTPPEFTAAKELPVSSVSPMVPTSGKGSKVPNYQCDLCAYTTDNKSNFEKHNRCHNASNRYPCEWCNWSTNTLNLLYRHAQTVHADELAQQEKDAFYGKVKDRGDRGSLGFGVKRPSTDSHSEDLEEGSEGMPETPPPRMGTSKRRRRLKTCPKCGYVTDNVTTLQRHMAKHGSNGKFTCDQCDYSVDRLHVLQYHQKIVHDAASANERIASSLGASVKSPKAEDNESMSEMEEHSMVDTDKEPLDDETDFRDTADEHGSSGDDTDVYADRDKTGTAGERRTSSRAIGSRRYRCMDCTFYTLSRTSIKRHRVMHRVVGKRLQCEQCDYKATIAENLRSHMKKQHRRRSARDKNEKKGRECESCPFTAESASAMRNHTRHHNCGLEYLCDFCDYAVSDMEQLLSHRKLHRAEPEYSEEYQTPRGEGGEGEAPAGRNTRRRSARMVEDEADCRECPYQTRSPTLLRNHMAYHSQQARFVCDLCTFSSPKVSQVQIHRNVHRNEDGFVAVKSKRSLLNEEYCMSIYSKRILDSLPQLGSLNKRIHKIAEAAKDVRKGSFACKQCPYSCGGKQALAAHNNMHRIRGSFGCGECTFGTDRFNIYCIHAGLHLTKSLADTLSRRKTRRCPKCLYCSRSRALMKAHLRSHKPS